MHEQEHLWQWINYLMSFFYSSISIGCWISDKLDFQSFRLKASSKNFLPWSVTTLIDVKQKPPLISSSFSKSGPRRASGLGCRTPREGSTAATRSPRPWERWGSTGIGPLRLVDSWHIGDHQKFLLEIPKLKYLSYCSATWLGDLKVHSIVRFHPPQVVRNKWNNGIIQEKKCISQFWHISQSLEINGVNDPIPMVPPIIRLMLKKLKYFALKRWKEAWAYWIWLYLWL